MMCNLPRSGVFNLKNMSKDPAVLFYTSDFLTGTMTMTNEQKGKYITLLCLQHQKNFLTEKDMLNICQTYDEDIFDKFIKSDDGYYNKRMMEEKDKRRNYSLSRSRNRNSKKNDIDICQSYVQHMENENENVNITTTIIKISKEEELKNLNCAEGIKNLLLYIEIKTDFVKKLKLQLTVEQAEEILKKFSKEEIKEVLSQMDNHAGLTKKYQSVYRTMLNWLKNQKKYNQSTIKSQNTFTGLTAN